MKRTLTFLVLMNENRSCDSWILKMEHCFSTSGIQLLAKTTSTCMFYYWVRTWFYVIFWFVCFCCCLTHPLALVGLAKPVKPTCGVPSPGDTSWTGKMGSSCGVIMIGIYIGLF